MLLRFRKTSIVLSAATIVACSSTPTQPAPDGGDSGLPTVGGGDAGDTDSADGAGDVGVPDCTTYCTEVMTNCTAANAQYPSMASCKAACATFPVGAIADTSGDTLGCRQYHGGALALSAPATHCAHAGPTGGDINVSDATAGTCGEGCEAFCSLAQATCTGANQQFADQPTCTNACKTFGTLKTPPYSTDDTATNDWGCRMYHLTVAADSPANVATHCAHIGVASSVCSL